MTIILEGQLFCNLLVKIDDEICWSPTRFQSLAIIFRYNPTRQHDFTIKKELYETSIFGSNFDRITIKLRIISICPVVLLFYTLPTSFLVHREDNGKHLTTCVGQMPKNLLNEQILSSIWSYWADLYMINILLFYLAPP